MNKSALEGIPRRTSAKRWDDVEEARLAEAYKSELSIEEIAEELDRTTGAIEARLRLLDLISYGPYTVVSDVSHLPGGDETPENNGKRWSQDDQTKLVAMHSTSPKPESLLQLANELGRSPRSLVIQLVNLGAITPELNPNPQPKPRAAPKSKKQKITALEKPTRTMKVSITPEFQAGQRAIDEGENLLILGSAGTGKSTFLKWLRKKIGDSKNYVVLAPTGMSALQVGGQTVHSFFGFKPQLLKGTEGWRKPRSAKMYEKLDLIIIDEISMVRADVFDAIDKFLQRYGPKKGAPFGGVQVLAMGDLFQLSPIVRREEHDFFREMFGTPFFFGCEAWREGDFNLLEFTKIFRQSDEPFINLLSRIRHGERSNDLLGTLNQRLTDASPQGAVILAARNRTVDTINERELNQLKGKLHTYLATTTGKVDEGSFTSPVELTLKVGARIMFTRNDSAGRWVNGTLGEVIECDKKTVRVKTDDGQKYNVEPMKWELTKYVFDDETDAPVATVAGTFSQLPLTLAWALTIHKAQGQTLENCTIDLSDGGAFADGQLYVALSRARALESIHLTQPITPADVRTSSDVKNFYETLR